MTILFFASTREITGCASLNWDVESPQTAEALWDWLGGRFPNLLPLKSSTRIARNGEWLQRSEILQPGDEVAVLPPVSGG
jgi:molybdopterin converting factor subunit 1